MYIAFVLELLLVLMVIDHAAENNNSPKSGYVGCSRSTGKHMTQTDTTHAYKTKTNSIKEI